MTIYPLLLTLLMKTGKPFLGGDRYLDLINNDEAIYGPHAHL